MSLYEQISKMRGKTTPGGGGGNKDWKKANFLKLKRAGRFTFRAYRFGPDKKLFAVGGIHWTGEKFPMQCAGEECEICKTSDTLRRDPLNNQRGWDMRKQAKYTFVFINPEDPNQFLFWETSEASARIVLPAIAMEGGWPGGWPEVNEVENFTKALEAGQAKICGPTGNDLVLNVEPKGQGFGVTSANVMRMAGRPLTQPEDETTPDPIETRKRIEEARARKGE